MRLVCEDGLPYQTASWNLWRDHLVFVPFATTQNWVVAKGTKVATRRTTYLDDALVQFSGYVAIDEVDDGPFCILSVVDNRRYNRLACCVLEHDPTHADVRIFRADVKGQLGARGKRVQGITTDGSSRYPAVLPQRWPGVPHPLCVFHVLKEINQAVRHALTHVHKHVISTIRTRKRGRPRKQDAAPARRMTRRKADVAELFEHRRLFVRHHLSAAQKKKLARLTRGQPQLRTLREIVAAVYQLFDRLAGCGPRGLVGPNCGRVWAVSRRCAGPCPSCSCPAWNRRCCFWTISSWMRPATPWNGPTAGSARRSRAFTAPEPSATSSNDWPWTCTANNTPPDAPKPFTASIGRGLRRDGLKIGRFHARNPNPCTLAAKVSDYLRLSRVLECVCPASRHGRFLTVMPRTRNE
ncbi:transposase [Gemmata obscuriglobus]|uniref:transposase n=1 Tax=Gemmata obscuriglobus TaxID=114 RepID=UPI000D6D70AA|nr:transposase [Gemmata obscuriglobus]VTS06896.1 transposase family protein : Uncharacterized protein OS=Candidatus Entotheonella sp. TSY2 GN=ETSY2_27840 PE=4 SV=1: DDE_Tnp_ISL3: AT_hook [Gemmata obscuriglobus UQM 2246]